MNKSALLAAALVLCTANAWAYENNAAGFSVKDRQPFYKMESAKLYVFSSFSTDEFDKIAAKNMGSVHIVNYYDTAEMSHFIDRIVEEAKELSVETATPDELERMKQEWHV